MGEKTTIAELKNIMVKVQVPMEDYTVIQPGLIIGGITTAKNTEVLTKLGVTHIINCAYDPTGKGNFIYVDTNEDYYIQRDFKCIYLGVRAADTARFNISKFFYSVADFIDNAIKDNGIVYVHCYMAISRSAVLVIAYYMIKHDMTLKEAVIFLRKKREIFPNDGFLVQLMELDEELRNQKS
ncbi:dual specificity protein phosphatase 3-like [Bradysia coprophila]|uniref:dual specificity protein phosphatase 3-like n=1 Tax=Bradysia coprophila TaxID=38358 RepID=UPI00187DB53B|nr:dual specificity protein phosphatase 3-like [Bradysia coprophila]XP_037048046.1 dual specificity protein phosphatase 3-like [Bradysia coprophila]XP_037048047.1 dual specificity protein phosphatase 3-like [Bradysia coprophila]XP_037048048.1 dual specificity protein phosphatase 3-like [Bradysia coprophila]